MYINKFERIVIKIGSSILVDEKGKPKKIWLKEFAKDIKYLVKKKKTNCNCFFWCHCNGVRIPWYLKKWTKSRQKPGRRFNRANRINGFL